MDGLTAIESLPGIHEILFRAAGVGFLFFEPPEGDQKAELSFQRPAEWQTKKDEWRQYLVVHQYYPTLREALIAEQERIKEKEDADPSN